VRFSKPSADTGEADPVVVRALDAYARGTGSEHDALTAVAASRLLIPVVAVLGGGSPPGEGTSGTVDRPDVQPGGSGGSPSRASTDMALPTLIGNDGRKAIIAFTGTPSLRLWREDARPVPVSAGLLWQAAAKEEAAAVVIDVAGPVPFVVEGARLAALAAGEPPPPPHLDPDIHAEVAAVASDFTLGPGERDTDLLVTLHTADIAAVRRTGQEIAMRLAGRLRRGIEIRTS
jgi:hypothetical protein